MSNFWKVIILVLGVNVLWGGAIYFRRVPIEQDLTARVEAGLNRPEFSDVAVVFKGRKGILAGRVDSLESFAKAERFARRYWGVRVIENRLEVVAVSNGSAALPEAASVSPGKGIQPARMAGLPEEFANYPADETMSPAGMPVRQISYQDNSTADEAVDADREFLKLELNKLLSAVVIEFDASSAALTPKSRQLMDKAGRILNRYPETNVEIQGHTDDAGPPEVNRHLSSARALTVYNYLIGTGVAAERLEVNGYGETRPIEDNRTAEGRRRNRRVVLQAL